MAAWVLTAALPCLCRGPSLWNGKEGLGTDRFFSAFAACFMAVRGYFVAARVLIAAPPVLRTGAVSVGDGVERF